MKGSTCMKTAFPILAYALGMLYLFSSLAWMHGGGFDMAMYMPCPLTAICPQDDRGNCWRFASIGAKGDWPFVRKVLGYRFSFLGFTGDPIHAMLFENL